MVERFGKEEQVKIFRGAGYRAGGFFARNYLDLTLEMSQFIAQLQISLKSPPQFPWDVVYWLCQSFKGGTYYESPHAQRIACLSPLWDGISNLS